MAEPKQEKKEDKAQIDKESFMKFLNEFMAESDRAAVVLGAAKLDLNLYQIIQKVLRPNPGSRDELLDGDSPLSTFSSKINLAYRLGLIDPAFVRALHLIRRIRNDFAHEVAGSNLDHGSHKDRVRELASMFHHLKGWHEWRKSWSIKWNSKNTDAALDFRVALAICSIRLEHAFVECQTLSDDAVVSLIPPKWLKAQEIIHVGALNKKTSK
jgi:hypothetical protein